MLGRLHWLDMPDIVSGAREKIVLRFTTGDSDFVDTSGFRYRLAIYNEPWFDMSGKNLIDVDGVVESAGELGRIVFNLSPENTKLNPNKSRYYCRITEISITGENSRVIFAGTFKVVESILFKKGETR